MGEHYLTDVRGRFVSLKNLADAALGQAETGFFATLGPEDNSLAVIVKHLSGNMVSRWGDLHADGESPNRDRDAEFIVGENRDALMAGWEVGWATLFRALDGLTADRLLDTVTIRGEPHTVMAAINRQVSHYAYHVGQIVFLAKHFQGERWESLSIPRGASAAYNREKMGQGEKDNGAA